jgi:hypothetical protein
MVIKILIKNICFIKFYIYSIIYVGEFENEMNDEMKKIRQSFIQKLN